MEVPKEVGAHRVQSHRLHHAQTVLPIFGRDPRGVQFAAADLKWFSVEQEFVRTNLEPMGNRGFVRLNGKGAGLHQTDDKEEGGYFSKQRVEESGFHEGRGSDKFAAQSFLNCTRKRWNCQLKFQVGAEVRPRFRYRFLASAHKVISITGENPGDLHAAFDRVGDSKLFPYDFIQTTPISGHHPHQFQRRT